MADDSQAELDYYRAIEDFFATLRGVPHTLSTKDFNLLRSWWDEGVPLAAVRAGIAEIFARRRERGDPEPVFSVQYCRHAVSRHARRIADMRVGEPEDGGVAPEEDTVVGFADLARALRKSADRQRCTNDGVARVITSIAESVDDAAHLPAAEAATHLYSLEDALLSGCLSALEPARREDLESRARAAARETSATADARERAFRAHRDRMLRDLLDLPRLEV